MTKWFKKILCRWVHEGRELEEGKLSAGVPIALGRSNSVRSIDQHGLNFSVYSAQGGTIIELRVYNEKTDCHNNKLYVVRDDQDLGKELDHIITLEALKR